LRGHLPPPATRRGCARVDVRPARGRRAGPAARVAAPLRFSRARPLGQRRGARGRARHAGEDGAEHLCPAAPGGRSMKGAALLIGVALLAGCGGSGSKVETLYSGGDWVVDLNGGKAEVQHHVNGKWAVDRSGSVKIE